MPLIVHSTHINDLLNVVLPQVELFADDCLLLTNIQLGGPNQLTVRTEQPGRMRNQVGYTLLM